MTSGNTHTHQRPPTSGATSGSVVRPTAHRAPRETPSDLCPDRGVASRFLSLYRLLQGHNPTEIARLGVTKLQARGPFYRYVEAEDALLARIVTTLHHAVMAFSKSGTASQSSQLLQWEKGYMKLEKIG